MVEMARPEKRRLVAILAADVVGYATLIAADEAGTLALLRALFREAVRPLVAAQGGRIFRLLGDALLAEFPSAVEALRCAMALQAAVVGRGAAEADRPHLALRIGIALGDVVVESGDLYGDGVNIAARLEALAEPGGILVSAAVAEQAHGRVACALEDAGLLQLKNIPHPVQGVRVRAEAHRAVAAPTPHNLASLAVLPFVGLGGEANNDRFADGITEELTTALARVRWFHVVAHDIASAYRNRRVDARQVGREFGVRHVLEGSVRRAGGRVRIAVRLMDAETGRHVWADHFDAVTADVFALQDAMAQAVVGAIDPALGRAKIEWARTGSTGGLNAQDLYLRALSLRLRVTREDSAAGLALLRRV